MNGKRDKHKQKKHMDHPSKSQHETVEKQQQTPYKQTPIKPAARLSCFREKGRPYERCECHCLHRSKLSENMNGMTQWMVR